MAADPWELLGVARGATPAAIRTAYRKLARDNHPDHGGSTERMAAINAAYEAIKDGSTPEPVRSPQAPSGWRMAWSPAASVYSTGSWRRARLKADPLNGEPRPGDYLGDDSWIARTYPPGDRTSGTGM